MKTHCDNHAVYDRTCVTCIALRTKAEREEANNIKMVLDDPPQSLPYLGVVDEISQDFTSEPDVKTDFQGRDGDFGGGGSSEGF